MIYVWLFLFAFVGHLLSTYITYQLTEVIATRKNICGIMLLTRLYLSNWIGLIVDGFILGAIFLAVIPEYTILSAFITGYIITLLTKAVGFYKYNKLLKLLTILNITTDKDIEEFINEMGEK